MKKILIYAEENLVYNISSNLDKNLYIPVFTNTSINKLYDYIFSNNINILVITRTMIVDNYNLLEQVLQRGIEVVFISRFKDIGLLRNAFSYDNFIYLKETDISALGTILDITKKLNKKIQILENDVDKLKNSNNSLKLVSRAKSLLMDNEKMTEKVAHKHIQKICMDTQRPVSDVSKEIIKKYN